MANESEVVTVHTINSFHRRGSVFYASLPCEVSDVGTLKQRLVSTLWDHLAAMETPIWEQCRSVGSAAFPIKVVYGRLGRPHLVVGEYRGPAVSFSKGGGRVWAAICGDDSDIGIDAAGTDEFQGEYPYHRVFHPEELQHSLKITGGDLEEASAMLWSIKEAVVKALGCAFHHVDPRQINVYSSAGWDGGHIFSVGLSGKALLRFPMVAGRSLWVHSLPQNNIWFSIAFLNCRSTGHE